MNASDPLGCYLHSEDFIDYSYEDSFTSGSKEFVSFFYPFIRSALSNSILDALMASYCLNNDHYFMDSLSPDSVPDLMMPETESIEPMDPNSQLFFNAIKWNLPKRNASGETPDKASQLAENRYLRQAFLAFKERQYDSSFLIGAHCLAIRRAWIGDRPQEREIKETSPRNVETGETLRGRFADSRPVGEEVRAEGLRGTVQRREFAGAALLSGRRVAANGFLFEVGTAGRIKRRARYLFEYIKRTFDVNAEEKLKIVDAFHRVDCSATRPKRCGTQAAKSSKSSRFERPCRRSTRC